MSDKIQTMRLGNASGRMIWTAVLAGMLLVACGPSLPPETAAPTAMPEIETNSEQAQRPSMEPDENAYPVPEEAPAVENAYPVAPLPDPTQVPDSYPAVEEVFAEPRFLIDQPLSAQDSVVTGQAPPDLALAVVDVSSGGIVLGSGISTEDGQFSIGVAELPVEHLVGITFSDLQPGKSHAQMSQELFPHRGEGFMNIPNIGIFFDTAVVGS